MVLPMPPFKRPEGFFKPNYQKENYYNLKNVGNKNPDILGEGGGWWMEKWSFKKNYLLEGHLKHAQKYQQPHK